MRGHIDSPESEQVRGKCPKWMARNLGTPFHSAFDYRGGTSVNKTQSAIIWDDIIADQRTSRPNAVGSGKRERSQSRG